MSTDSSSNEDSMESDIGNKLKFVTGIGMISFFSSIIFLILSEFTSVIPRMVGFALLALAIISGIIVIFLAWVIKWNETVEELYLNNDE